MTRFWQRRLSVILLVAGVLVAGLYGASFVVSKRLEFPQVGIYSVVAACIAIIIGIYTLVNTHTEDINENSRLCYLMLATLIGVTIYSTGVHTSPFVIFWALIVLTAPLFGGWGVGPVALITLGVPFFQHVTGHSNFATAWQVAAIGIVPLLFGFLIKPQSNAKGETDEDKSYRALAKELSQATGKSDVVINAIGEGVLSVDGTGVIQLINPAAQQIVGWGQEDAVGLNYKSILQLINSAGEPVDASQDPVARTFTSNTPTTDNTLSLLTQSNKKLLVSVVVSPIGQPGAGAIIVFRDITNEKSEERQQAEFISTASHEMRTPVATIEGYLGLVLNPQTAQIDEKARDFITKAHEAAQHLGRLFQDLLDVSKAEDGRMQSVPKLIDVNSFMHDVVEGLRPKAEQKGLTLVFKPTVSTGTAHDKGVGRSLSPTFYVNVDKDHLREVADNLVENAIKYTPKGQVTVDVTGTDQKVTIAITDTGLGIPREDIPHLFQKFYRVDNSATREIGGTGLGLYLCRRLIEAMNGRLWVESTFQQGSTFYVELPRTSSIEANQLIQQAEASVEQDRTASASALPPDDLVAAITGEPATAVAPAPVMAPQPAVAVAAAVMQQPIAPPAVVAPIPTPVQPVAMPTPQAVPTPIAPQPPVPVAAPRYNGPAYVPHPMTNFQNTPLTAIEQNPGQYIAQTQDRTAVAVPPRQP